MHQATIHIVSSSLLDLLVQSLTSLLFDILVQSLMSLMCPRTNAMDNVGPRVFPETRPAIAARHYHNNTPQQHNKTTEHNNNSTRRDGLSALSWGEGTWWSDFCQEVRGDKKLARFPFDLSKDSSTGIITQMKLRPRKLPITTELRAIANMVGKSSKEQRRHMASRYIQQRARRIRINNNNNI